MPSRELRYTTKALRDIRTIMRYTHRRWGEDAAAAYEQRLGNATQRLAAFPELGRVRAELSPGARGFPVGEHIIIYSFDDISVNIVRILHARMDASTEIAR